MGWYDTYRNTKINYWLIPMNLAMGPILYFYVRSITSKFRFKKQDLFHFIPWVALVALEIFIFIYDAVQPGFKTTQNGVLKSEVEFVYINPLVNVIEVLQITLYLAFSIQLFLIFKSQLRQYFSNVYSLELGWLRDFLYIYTFLFLFNLFQTTIDAFIVDLNWTQSWWYHFLSAIAIIYVGIKGYFTDTSRLQNIDFRITTKSAKSPKEENPFIDEYKTRLISLMSEKKPYLDPNINLSELAVIAEMSSTGLSEVINTGFGMNFNDFINSYRVFEFKKLINQGKSEQFSLVGVAYDCGFNSKATFNRVFKKQMGIAPSEYLQSQNK